MCSEFNHLYSVKRLVTLVDLLVLLEVIDTIDAEDVFFKVSERFKRAYGL